MVCSAVGIVALVVYQGEANVSVLVNSLLGKVKIPFYIYLHIGQLTAVLVIL